MSANPGRFVFEANLDLRAEFRAPGAGDLFTILRWTRGAGELTLTNCGEHNEGRRRFQGETLVLLSPEARLEFHGESPAPALQGNRLSFDEEFLCAREDNSALVAPPQSLFYTRPVLRPDPEAGIALGRVYQDLADNADDFEIARSYLKILLLKLKRFAESAPKPGDPAKAASTATQNGASADRFREFRRLVDRHYREWHRPAQYAERMFLSTRCLNEITNAAVESSPSRIIQKRILFEARRLLRNESAPIGGIARELGFGDASYFSRFFRKHAGMTPESFRRQPEDA